MRLGSIVLLAVALTTIACGVNGAAGTAAKPTRDKSEVWVTLQATSKVLVLQGSHERPTITPIQLSLGMGPHITTFSPDNRYAYVAGMGNGDLDVIRTETRQLASILHLGPAGTHQVRASPDGSVLLAAQVATQTLIKLSADEAHNTWSTVGALSFGGLNRAPVCSLFRDDGKRAYVSLSPTGVAIVDVETMMVVDTLPVAGFIACGMAKSPDGKSVMMASSGGGGHIYRLNTATDRLTDLGALGASDWHSFNTTADQKLGVGTVPGGDEVRLVDLTSNPVRTAATLALDPTPGMGNDQPDAVGIRGQTAWVSLRKSGKLAVIDLAKRGVVAYLNVAQAAESINPTNCTGCTVHGVTVRA